ncbi:hypothetical protein BGZ94_001048 [Podila epigama]|nr:hypothetical protein BGZ94_001048 [Podila epigama]
MLSSKLRVLLVTYLLGLMLTVEALPITQQYSCFVIFGKIQRCYNGRTTGLVSCTITNADTGDQAWYEPRSLTRLKYPFGTSKATLTTLDGGSDTISVATFRGSCDPDYRSGSDFSPAP